MKRIIQMIMSVVLILFCGSGIKDPFVDGCLCEDTGNEQT